LPARGLATDVARIVVYVTVSLYWAHGWAVRKRLNGLRCRLGLIFVFGLKIVSQKSLTSKTSLI